MTIRFEWDEAKRRVNLEKHGLDFADAPILFSRPVLLAQDRKRDYGEVRHNALGMLGDIVVFAAFTVRDDAVRIISLRAANRKERDAYAQNIAQ